MLFRHVNSRASAGAACVTRALVEQHDGLALITSGKTPPDALDILRDALGTLAGPPRYKNVCNSMLIGGIAPAVFAAAWLAR